MIYNVVLISAIYQSDLGMHICTFFFIFFSIIVYPERLDVVPSGLLKVVLFFIFFPHLMGCVRIFNQDVIAFGCGRIIGEGDSP